MEIWRAEYPFDSHFLPKDGVNIHYVDEGEGPVLLMVHGNPTWTFYWRRLIAYFQNQYRVVAIDQIGCGLSDKPQRHEYRLARRIEELLYLIEALKLERITLVAHDWGGAVGLGAALKLPQRFQRLVLFNTGAFPPPYIPWQLRLFRVPLLGTWAIRGANLFVRGALRYATAQPQRFTKVVRAGYLAPYNSWANRVAVDSFVKDIPFTPRHPTWHTLRVVECGLPFLARRPVCIIWGMRDWCFRAECLQRFCRCFPEAEVHRMADAGHFVVEDASDRVTEILAGFLKRTDR